MEPSMDRRAFDAAVWDFVLALEPLLERRRTTEAALQDLWGLWERLSPLSASVRESSQAIASASNALRKMAVTLSVEISRHRLDENLVGTVARDLWTWSERMAESARSMASLLAKVQQTVGQLEDGLRALRDQSEQEMEAAEELLLHAERLHALLEKQDECSGPRRFNGRPRR
ncbi:MAG: hypothetical protein K6T83_04955 [Alicyclobacillus sp.]|nr:hypothetical protein [Alicyclobacillus sp.]